MTSRLVHPSQAQAAPISELMVFPCSSSQERCWFINAMSPGNPALNVALRWELKGLFRPVTIEKAFRVIIERHEALRTQFVEEDGVPLQQVVPRSDFKLSEIDLTMFPQSQRLDEALRLGRLEAHRPFDLAKVPLIRVTLLRLAVDHALLLVTIHQIAFDGWSIRLISKEFGVIAASIDADQPYDLPDLPLQYGDFAAWQKAYLASGQFEREKSYWRHQLAGAPYFEVAGDRVRPTQSTYNGEIVAAFVPDTLTDLMMQRIKQQRLTLFSFGCAVIAAVLHHYTGCEDLCIGTQIAGRDDPDLEPLIGVFINNLVLRLDTSGDLTFLECLKRVNQTVQDALTHRRMPFHMLVELLKPPRDPRRMPLISVNFTVLQDVMDDARYGTFELLGQPSLSAGSLYDLNFFMVHWPTTGWRIALEYNTDLFERSTGETILELWLAVLKMAVEKPDFRLSGLALRGRHAGALGKQDVAALIETALLRHPDIATAAVVAREAGDGVSAPYAVVTLRSNFDGSLDAVPTILTAFLSRTMPEAHLPARIDVRMMLPRTSGGSIDRLALAKSLAGGTPSPLSPSSRDSASNAERLLMEIWKEVLGVDTITPDANFFEFGGHSLSALRMLSKVTATFGQKFSASTLFSSPTLRAFASCIAIEEQKFDEWKIVPIQADGSRTPIIAFNNSVMYYNLAQSLGADRPVLGVQMFDPENPRALEPRTLEEIAADYVRLIRIARPRGPYILMGLCVAGDLAYESAQQLRRAGEKVPLVILADAWAPGFRARLPAARQVVLNLNFQWNEICHRGGRYRQKLSARIRAFCKGQIRFTQILDGFPKILRTGIPEFATLMGIIKYEPTNLEDWESPWFLAHLLDARRAYNPAPADGILAVLQSDQMSTRFADKQMGWGPLAKHRLAFRAIPGWHRDMFQEPGIDHVAEFLRPLLAEIDDLDPSPVRREKCGATEPRG